MSSHDHPAPVDVVPQDEITAPWWDATRHGVLLLQRCRRCGHLQHYPRAVCTACGGVELGWAAASGEGSLDSYTMIHRSPDPALPAGHLLARVRLVEGPVLLSRLVGDLGDGEPRCDQPVRLAWQPLPDGRRLPVFEAIRE
jgi:uncharacterized protein